MMSDSKHHIRQTFKLAVPIAASQVSDMLVLTADAIMVGTLGAVALAGVTLANASTIIVMLFAVGYSIAITPLAGHAFGRSDLPSVARIARAGTLVSTLITLLLILLLLLASPYLHVMGSPANVTEVAIPFFRWLVASFIFRILFGAFKQTAEAMANTRVSMIINLGINILNVFFVWLFVFGNLNMPRMGAEGAGFATFLARGFSAIAAWLVFTKSSFFKDLRAELKAQRKAKVPLMADVKHILKDGTGIGLQIVTEVLAFATGAIMMGWMSATAMAAHQVAINPASITFMVALGLGSAATVRVSNLRGMKDANGAKKAALTALGMVVVYMIVVAFLYVVLRFQLPYLFVSDPKVVELAATLLLYAAAFSIFDGIQVVGLGVLRGYGDIRIPTIIATISYLVITIPVGYITAFKLGFGPAGIWIGYLVGLIFASISYLFRIRLCVQNRLQQTAVVGQQI